MPFEIERSKDGRPRIILPDGSKSLLYTRASKFASTLDDSYGLDLWHQRLVALGLVDNQWLLTKVDGSRNEPGKLNEICGVARDKAGGNEKSAYGTMIHKLTECIDLGLPLGKYPPAVEDELVAYEYATRNMEPLLVERFVAQDEIRVAGTPDRVERYEGSNYIGDLKTGNIERNGVKFAIQLAVYSRSVLYEAIDPDALLAARRPLPDVDQERGIIIHLPMGEATATLYWVNLTLGWEAVQLARAVKKMRLTKKILEPFEA